MVVEHKYKWREVSSAPSGKKVYFCFCLGPHKSCGLVAVLDKTGATLRIVD